MAHISPTVQIGLEARAFSPQEIKAIGPILLFSRLHDGLPQSFFFLRNYSHGQNPYLTNKQISF